MSTSSLFPEAPKNGELERKLITNTDAALRFVMAGNAYFTLRSKRTEARYTFRVAAPKSNQDIRFVSLLVGPDNVSNYAYIGLIKENGEFTLTKGSKMGEDTLPVRAFKWFYVYLRESTNRLQLPMDVEFWHEGRCGRCGRMLTVPESIAAGIGPECAGRMAA